MRFQRALPAKLYRQVTAAHPYRFTKSAPAGDHEMAIDRRWRLVLDRPAGPLSRRAGVDFVALLRDTFGIQIGTSGTGDGPAIHVRIDASRMPAAESYSLDIRPDGIEVVATDDEGAMRALFHLGRSMLNRRAPVLARGRQERRPHWPLRITSPVLHRTMDEPGDYLDMPDAYWMNLARFGYNATYLYMNFFDLMRPETGGPLARPGWKQRIDDLRRTSEHLSRFGIRLLFHVNLLALPGDHRLFRRHPAMRGAQTWSEGLHCLCSGSPQVLQMLRQASSELFEAVPLLAGGILIVGGECYLHCYTRPEPKPGDSGTNCPRCAQSSPDRVVAGVVNAFAEGALAAKPDAHILAWPYSAFSWGNVATQQAMLKNLHAQVNCLAAFEKDDWLTIDGVRSYVFDYSISQLGPSPLFRSLGRAAAASGRKMLAKTESSQCIELFNVPRIPVMHRWAERFQRLRDANLGGIHSAWRFYGFCAQRTDEIVDHFNWEPRPDIDALLATLAGRDFGPAASQQVVRAWRQFSDAFARFPYCAGVTGFPYFRGPFFIGPAHPLVFDLTAPIDLPDRFWSVDPSAEEAGFDMPRQPKFFVDLTWTQPLGSEIVQRRLAEIDRDWHRGVAQLERARRATRGEDRRRLDDEIGVARMIGCMFRTANHLARFQRLRENVTAAPCTLAQLRSTCRKAAKILVDEIENAGNALELVRRDASLGYGATYGYAFDADLIAQKIRHAQDELHRSVPRFFQQHAFHAFGRFESFTPT